MFFNVIQTDDGFSIELTGQKWQADTCALKFPADIWDAYRGKASLVRELAYVTTLATPLMLNHGRVQYNTASPEFLHTYIQSFERAIPNLVEPIPEENAHEILQRVRNLELNFNGPPAVDSFQFNTSPSPGKVILPFSFGKDSLLTLGLLRDAGYTVIPVIIDERVLPRGFAMKTRFCQMLEKETGIRCHVVTNQVQLLSDYQVLEVDPTRLYQVQVYFVYLLAMLPFCAYYGAPFIAMNNEYANTLQTMHKNNILTPKRTMQGKEMTRILSRMTKKITDGRVGVVNLLGGLGDFAIHRLLHERFPRLGQYRISCHMEMTEHRRWCHGCERCARAFLFSKALGYDIPQMGFEHTLLEEEHAEFFSLFHDYQSSDRYRKWNAMEEAVAFHLAEKNGDTFPLVKKAASLHGDSNRNIEKLYKKIFTMHKNFPRSFKMRRVHAITRKTLGSLFNPQL